MSEDKDVFEQFAVTMGPMVAIAKAASREADESIELRLLTLASATTGQANATLAKAASEIRYLREELDEWKQCCQVEAGLRREFLERAEKAEARVTALEAALMPFVTRAVVEDSANDCFIPDRQTVVVTLGDCRRARAAIPVEQPNEAR